MTGTEPGPGRRAPSAGRPPVGNETSEPRARGGKPPSIGLGAERLGLVSLRHPVAIGVAAAALIILGLLGIRRLEVDDSLSQLFRSDSAEFRQYEAVSKQFPSSEYDVLAVVTGPVLDRTSIEALRSLATDLQLVDDARGLVSIFSARTAPTSGRLPAPLFPEPLPEGQAYDRLVEAVRSNEILKDKLLSSNGALTLMVLALAPDAVESDRLASIVGEIRSVVDTDLAGTGLKVQLTGVPVMQLEIRHAIERDRVLYNVAGLLVGCLIAVVFFRRVSFMLVAAGPPLVSILLALGAFGWLDLRLNIFLNMMTPLIMVISFSDSMQLTYDVRARLIAGMGKREAIRDALLVVGPACVLTHATAAISFIALQASESDLIRDFGKAGLLATAIALVAVLTLMPVLSLLLLRRTDAFAEKARKADPGVGGLRRFCAHIAGRMVDRPGLYTALGLAFTALLAIGYLQLQPRYRLADEVPGHEQAVPASDQLDRDLTGANPIDVMIRIPPGEDLYSARTLAVIAEVHRMLAQQPGVGNVWSLETLRIWLAENGLRSDAGTIKGYVEALPNFLVRRFVSADDKAVLVTGRVRDIDASHLLPVVRALDRALVPVRQGNPGYTVEVTSLSAIAARNSARMIDKLSRGITVEVVFIAAALGLVFRSVRVMVASILPAIFPVVATGTLLWLTDDGLRFASVVALTVSLGLGLSATIHFLNRMTLDLATTDRPERAVEQATVQMGPPLILTTVVLSCAFAITVLSSLPMLRLFGWLSALAMLFALVADLLILRPAIALLYRKHRAG
ncbi:efflux RND transporter permease subunit [Methylobacterium sp. J-070]|uniref:efflux RND transporter permease subunit n=1 Tax=Methylobacterium sp. J-070 TaxID=2836650 RepID=UPI00391B6DEF